MEISVFCLFFWLVISLLVGGALGFLLSRSWFKNYLKKNPPVNENMIKEMMRQWEEHRLKSKLIRY